MSRADTRITALRPEYAEDRLLIGHYREQSEHLSLYRDWFLDGVTALQWYARFQPRPRTSDEKWLEQHLRPVFQEERYLLANPDVAEAVRVGSLASGWQHFVSHGATEGRLLDLAHFDEATYLLLHTDVAEAVHHGKVPSALMHMQSTGGGERRIVPLLGFDPARYVAAYPEVQPVVDGGYFRSPYHHYLFFGQRNGYCYWVQ